MRKETINGHKVEIFDSIDELPEIRFHKFNKYLLIDSGVGSDMNDINSHIIRIQKFMETDKASAIKELENLRLSLYLIIEEVSPKHLAFVPLIKSLDGEPLTDLSDTGIKKISELLNGTPVGFFDRLFESVKKKIDQELILYFPGQFESSREKEYHDLLQRATLLKLDHIIRKTDNKEKIEKASDALLTFVKPKSFSGKSNFEIAYDKEFEELCLFLRKELGVDPESMTVLQFYTSLGYIKKLKKK